MEQIIKPGPDKFVVICRQCGATYSYKLEDICRDLDDNMRTYCPVCNIRNEHKINIQTCNTESIDYVGNIEFNG